MRHLIVYEVRSTGSHPDDVTTFMSRLLHTDYFHLPVERIWRDCGRPPIFLIDGTSLQSRIKRVRVIP